MEKKTMRPTTVLLPLSLSLLLLSLLRPAAALCKPRNPSHFFLVPTPSPSSSSSSSSSSTPSSSSPPPPMQQSPSPPPPPKQQYPPPPTPTPSPATPTPSTGTSSSFSTAPGFGALPMSAIKSVCDRSTFPDLCLSSVKPHLSTSTAAGSSLGLTAVLELLVKATKEKTQAAIEELNKGANDPKADKTLKMILQGCVDKYTDALDNLDTAMESVHAKDLATAQSDFAAASSDFDTCANGDAPEDPVMDSSTIWRKTNEVLFDLVENCMDLCTFLK